MASLVAHTQTESHTQGEAISEETGGCNDIHTQPVIGSVVSETAPVAGNTGDTREEQSEHTTPDLREPLA